ncbi:MogA/MoaB family molybdenum cofactor biosynthesis protein [Pelovirga terrestris]|uniref:Molybdopterin adenylyltransferase n=1 Tax=Pelovirga terrestris TaxID=2771352 RepID=A0A8J6QYN0_9BACT|nr:MogA/MoaB family molybdenum cofactor biosynthesis protein [Pelovirga terrestris]MBD1401373.1 MogA/MoaB family molybdenum cofactor biosynthesis protein [Pelovirga terrestris]
MTLEKFRIGILTLSDKGARGERIDESGPLLSQMVAPLGDVVRYQIIPDEMQTLALMLTRWVDDLGLDLILTTGGTGLSPRDQTPQATASVLDYQIPGMAEAMRAASLAKTPHAMLSRALVGVRKQSLIINLPGSPKGASENFSVLLPVLPHALAKLKGDPTDCAVTP